MYRTGRFEFTVSVGALSVKTDDSRRMTGKDEERDWTDYLLIYPNI
jgi:hypothetical protein